MSEIKHITFEIRPPNHARNYPGQYGRGCYKLDGDTVTLVNPDDGTPVRDDSGKLYQDKVGPGTADADALARMLSKQFRLARMGKTESSERFSRPINYPRDGGIV